MQMMMPPQGGDPMVAARQGMRGQLDAEAEGKVSPEEANLRPAEEGPEDCGHCVHSQFPPEGGEGTCELVAGPISVDTVSDLFEPNPKPGEGALTEGAPPQQGA